MGTLFSNDFLLGKMFANVLLLYRIREQD